MNKVYIPTTICLTLMMSSAIITRLALAADNPATDTSSTEYKLVWSDEFNKNGSPDSNNWTYENGFVRNRELQWYQPENAHCENGLLIIEGRREKKKNPNYNSESSDWKRNREYADYTSASITTRHLHDWMYGRFEMRGRIDTRDGLWPAFWTLGSQGSWPACGEIDIMEYYKGTLLANAAWASGKQWTPIWDDSRKPISDFNDPDWSAKFHLWRMDWDPNSIKLYVDDMLLNTVDLNQTFNKDSEGKNPFRQPHYIILNLAIGGTAGGDPSKTEFPAKFEVDYVRIYQNQAKQTND
jgi:beta-glucanase (GH16 family)